LPLENESVERFSMNDVWSLFTTRDGVSAQLSTPRAESFATADLEATPSAVRVATAPRRITPLFRRLRTAAA
jgi:hypothetical protein